LLEQVRLLLCCQFIEIGDGDIEEFRQMAYVHPLKICRALIIVSQGSHVLTPRDHTCSEDTLAGSIPVIFTNLFDA
jgi:hypothetical protein